jgi:hypothetical protein
MCAAIQVCRYFNGVARAMLDLACGKPSKGSSAGRFGSPHPNAMTLKQILFFDLNVLPYEWQAEQQ